MEADFQLFIRPNRRSSNAGFPTKMGESMAVGTPVITNNTGDIELYLTDSENGYMLRGNGIEAVRTVLDQILKLCVEDYVEMRKRARITAEQVFDYHKYVYCVEALLKEVNEI